MVITLRFAGTAMFAGLALGFATPASAAANEMSGHYTATITDVDGQAVTNDWYVTPCGDGCASLASAPGAQPFGQAQLAGGQWTMDTVDDDDCSDGTTVPSAIAAHYVWDANTLAGTIQDSLKVPACGQPVGFRFTNTIQVQQAP
jgi:hypothetical protein